MMWFTTREEPLTGLAREVSRSSLTSDHHDDGGKFGGLRASLGKSQVLVEVIMKVTTLT